ncbi:DsbA family protein [Acuticoccus sediminis]|nr:DsbA family protein [Acuticoccus sediminis]
MITRRHFAAMTLALPLAATSLNLAFAQDAAPAEKAPAEPPADIVLGSDDAPVTIVEYASMTCPHCAAFHNGPFKDLKKDYIDTGKVKFILREFPLDRLALAVAVLARCKPEKYYDIVDLYFEQQQLWATNDDPVSKMFSLAQQAGFSREEFEACLNNRELLEGIYANRTRGEQDGVTGTPTLFIDGEKYEGERTIAALREVLDPKIDS